MESSTIQGESRPLWAVVGHESADLAGFVSSFTAAQKSSFQFLISTALQPISHLGGFAGAVFLLSAKTGIDSATISLWDQARERQLPRILAINGLLMSEIDFDDIVLIANRVLDPVITPFLVLHDDLGAPVGLIELATLEVRDYSGLEPERNFADAELQELVAEFRSEYLVQIEEFGESAFADGLLFPAIPVIVEKNIGQEEIITYIKQVTTL